MLDKLYYVTSFMLDTTSTLSISRNAKKKRELAVGNMLYIATHVQRRDMFSLRYKSIGRVTKLTIYRLSCHATYISRVKGRINSIAG